MIDRFQGVLLALGLGLALMACTSPAPADTRTQAGPEPQQSAAPKRLVGGMNGEPELHPAGSGIAGAGELRGLVNSSLTLPDDQKQLRPQLAEVVPTTENGLWKVFPDGRMETTWKIRPSARWHDGAPFTAEDILFTLAVGQDRELPAFGDQAYRSIEQAEASDARTVVIKWKAPYVDADAIFAQPLPKHLLQKAYADEKSSFTELRYWRDDYVGSGPYQLREWSPGSHMILAAYDGYVLGRPKIDELEIRFILDTNVLMANLLSGALNLTVGRGLSIGQAVQLREQWKDGEAYIGFTGWIVLFPQFLNPDPAVIGDVQFRRALLHSIDRQEMADSLQAGVAPVAHSYLSPNQPGYREIEAGVIRYDFDPRRAVQLIEGLGYAKGPDGAFRDRKNEKLDLEIRTIGVPGPEPMFAVTGYWTRIGVGVSPVVIPLQRSTDSEYRATYPGFQIFNNPNDVGGLPALHSSRARLPENNYAVSGLANHARYINPEFDALIERYFTTVPKPERAQVLGQIVYHISDQLNLMGLYYSGTPDMVSTRVSNYHGMWNVHEWDTRGL